MLVKRTRAVTVLAAMINLRSMPDQTTSKKGTKRNCSLTPTIDKIRKLNRYIHQEEEKSFDLYGGSDFMIISTN